MIRYIYVPIKSGLALILSRINSLALSVAAEMTADITRDLSVCIYLLDTASISSAVKSLPCISSALFSSIASSNTLLTLGALSRFMLANVFANTLTNLLTSLP